MSEVKNEYSNLEQVDFLVDRAGCSKKDAEMVVSMFWGANLYHTLLEDGYYLNLITEYLKERKIIPDTRRSYYDYFRQVLLEDSSVLAGKVSKLAFVMDLMQVIEIDKDDAGLILGAQEIDFLLSKKVFSKVGERIKFHHSSVHSYFTASYLVSSKGAVKFIESLVEASGTVPPAWYEVMAFALQANERSDLIEWLTSQLLTNQNLIEEGLLEAIEQARIEEIIDAKTKRKLFKIIWVTYSKRNIWLPDSAEKVLARFSDSSTRDFLYKTLEEYDETNLKGIVTRGNIVAVIDEALNFKMLNTNESEKWHIRLAELATDTNDNGVLQRRAIHALEYFKDRADITKIASAFDHKDKFVREAFVRFCHAIAPNERRTIQYLAKVSLQGSSIYARYGYYDISTKQGIHNFFSVLGSDSKYIAKFLDDDSIFNGSERNEDARLIQLVRKFDSDQMLQDVAKFLIISFRDTEVYHVGRLYFIRQLTEYLVSKDKDLTYLNQILEVTEKPHNLFDIGELFAAASKKSNYEKVLASLLGSTEDSYKQSLTNTFYSCANAEVRDDAIAKRHYELPQQSKNDMGDEREKDTYKDFLVALEPEPGRYMLNIFSNYLRDAAVIDKFMTKDDRKRFEYLVRDTILDKFDPIATTLKINGRNKDNSVTNFTITSITQIYGDVVKVAVRLFDKEEIANNYRVQLINFLPYSDYEDREIINDLLGKMQPSEIELLSSFYAKKTDARYYMTDSFSDMLLKQAAKNVDISKAENTLKSLIQDDLLRIYERRLALETLGKIVNQNLITFLRKVFNTYLNTDYNALAEEANRVLIVTFGDSKATKWRFKEIASRSAPFVHTEGMHSVGAFESELHDKGFGGVLTKVNEKYLNDFLFLMDVSFRLLKTDSAQYMNYASYIWSLTVEYFEHLVHQENSHIYLAQLESWYKKKSTTAEGANWFENKLEGLRKLYASEAVKQPSIQKAITLAESLDG